MKKLVCFIVAIALAFGSSDVQAQSLTTTFAGGNGFAGNMFDLNVLAADGLTIEAFDINADTGASGTAWFYYKSGTYSGSEMNAGDWNLVGSYAFTSAGEGNPTNIDVDDFNLAAGMNSIYMITDSDINYTNGTNEGDLFAANADLEFFEGIGRGDPTSAGGFDGSVFSPRIWNGTIYYSPSAIPEPSAVGIVAVALAGIAARRRRK